MALQKKRTSEVPRDAIILSEKKALIYQSRILNTWPERSDTFGYRNGKGLLAVATLFTGIYANNHFRTKFRLMNYGRMSSYLPISVIPAAMSVLIHQNIVLPDVILNNYSCPICIQSRAAALQTLTGFVIPFLVAPVMSLSLVHRFHTFDMPYLSKEPLKVLQILGGQFGKIKNVAFGIFLAQALLASLVTYWESDSVYKVYSKLLQDEKNEEFAS